MYCRCHLIPIGINLKHNKRGLTMSVQMNVKPIDEQNYLKNNALLGLFTGMLFSGDIISRFFYNNNESDGFFSSGLLIAGIIVAILMMYSLFQVAQYSCKIKKRTFYYGNFKDEYLNHINSIGYKYAFNIICCYLLFVFFSTEYPKSNEAQISYVMTVKDFCLLTIGIVFLSYSTPVLYMLKGVDDE